MRVWAVSDLHSDYPQNLQWVQQWCGSGGSSGEAGASANGSPHGSANGRANGSADGGTGPAPSFRDDVILVAGDVSDSLETLEATLACFAGAFRKVFWCPGNHDLWVRRQERGQYDSLEKLRRIKQMCERLGVATQPACVGGVWVVPLLSWYHASWDREPDVPGSTPISKVMLDFHVCSWASQPGLGPEGDALARHFDALNEPAFSGALQAIEEQTAAAGGVRPPELLPEKRMLYYPNLAKASGSEWLERRIRRLRPDAHVFGHTHFSWDAELEGVRYVQWPLGYPHEHSRRRGGGAGWQPLPLWDGGGGGFAPRRHCYWSEYYDTHGRNPENVTAAPWVMS